MDETQILACTFTNETFVDAAPAAQPDGEAAPVADLLYDDGLTLPLMFGARPAAPCAPLPRLAARPESSFNASPTSRPPPLRRAASEARRTAGRNIIARSRGEAADAAALASWRDEATAQGLSGAIYGAWPAARAAAHGDKQRAQHAHMRGASCAAAGPPFAPLRRAARVSSGALVQGASWVLPG